MLQACSCSRSQRCNWKSCEGSKWHSFEMSSCFFTCCRSCITAKMLFQLAELQWPSWTKQRHVILDFAKEFCHCAQWQTWCLFDSCVLFAFSIPWAFPILRENDDHERDDNNSMVGSFAHQNAAKNTQRWKDSPTLGSWGEVWKQIGIAVPQAGILWLGCSVGQEIWRESARCPMLVNIMTTTIIHLLTFSHFDIWTGSCCSCSVHQCHTPSTMSICECSSFFLNHCRAEIPAKEIDLCPYLPNC